MAEQQDVISALVAEGDDLDHMVSELGPSQWTLPTPAVDWTIAHQVAHLAATFRMAAMAAADPVWFKSMAAGLSDDFDANMTAALSPYLNEPPGALLARWRVERSAAESARGAMRSRLVQAFISTVVVLVGVAGWVGVYVSVAVAAGLWLGSAAVLGARRGTVRRADVHRRSQ